ncbi:ribosome maturation factor RimP [Brachybacterium squillarum]|uniref:ribosome maturation factor RimP n=1 Tax=Brachybacterium squillarum TaxID=661979 RepID=UPI002223EA43|nr:ribosome assembly cofactor RimP [Brachybacterium squillarum]MCW1805200.1 ribosome assembly cofactor RimP [Brachybacterium squillarum]
MSTLDPYPALREAAERLLADHDLVLEDIEVRPRSGMPEIRIVVDLPEDRSGSVDLDAVALVSRELSALVDEDDALLGPDPALLEVTTPGVDRPLTAARHFRRARGRLVELRTVQGEEHRARILAVTEAEAVLLRPEAGRDDRGRPRKLPAGTPDRLEIPVADVESARVQIEFDPPADLEQLLAEAGHTAPKES